MSDLKPMLLNVCRECREGRGGLTLATELCRIAGCYFFERRGPIQPIKPARTREELLKAATEAVKAGRKYAVSIPGEKYLFVAPEDEAYDVLVAAGVIEPREQEPHA